MDVRVFCECCETGFLILQIVISCCQIELFMADVFTQRIKWKPTLGHEGCGPDRRALEWPGGRPPLYCHKVEGHLSIS